MAKAQITHFLQKDGHKADKEDIDKIFHVIDGILYHYSGETQRDMNIAAARLIMVADYRLTEAYKQVMDCFPSAEIKELVHEDYKYLFDTCQRYMNYRYEQNYYSDLPQELNRMYVDILMAKTASINRLMETKASEQTVARNLSEHYCFEDGKFFKLTYNTIDAYSKKH